MGVEEHNIYAKTLYAMPSRLPCIWVANIMMHCNKALMLECNMNYMHAMPHWLSLPGPVAIHGVVRSGPISAAGSNRPISGP